MKIILAAVFMTLLVVSGCTAEKYGAGVDPTAKKVEVKDIILYPDLQGKTVTLQGIITSQCQSNGCWFFLQDGTGQAFINLAPAQLAIWNKTGKSAKVTGIVANTPQGAQIIASGIEIL